MLHSLEIRNYRNLRHLTIEKLGRVNLLVGKNNTGKTSVLEAVYLWVNNGRFDIIYSVLEAREGTVESTAEDRYQRNKTTLASIFTNRKITSSSEQAIFISVNDNNSSLTLSFEESHSNNDESKLLAFSVRPTSLNRTLLIPLHQTINPKDLDYRPYDWPDSIKNQFIKANGVSSDTIDTLYDDIATTDWEDEVVGALKIVDKGIGKLAFRTDKSTGKRYAVVRLENNTTPVPLRSMGDGVNRILAIILAMVNCEDGYLLIDEFENGLHYSVQEKLWEIVFDLAKRLNIQVFATTHSNDTIRSFTSVLAKQNDPNEAGKAIRLQMHNDTIRAVDYSQEELETAVDDNIEVR